MGFFDAIIAIYILANFSQYFYLWRGHKIKNRAWLSNYMEAIMGFFLLYGILMYLNVLSPLLILYNQIPWIASDPFIDGPDYMWNSFRFIGFNPGLTVISALDYMAPCLFLCYYPVYTFGDLVSQALFGKRSYERGVLWAISPLKKPKAPK
jgi:hypothetical protein